MSKKAKAGGRKKGGAPPAKGKRRTQKPRQVDGHSSNQQQNPYDRVNFVRPLWETLTETERVELLTVKLEDVYKRAAEQASNTEGDKAHSSESLDPAADIDVEGILKEGLSRLKDQGTWKVWNWSPEGKSYIDAEAFRQEAEAEHISEDLRQLLPRDEGKPIEKPAEAALRERMTSLLSQIHVQLQNAQDAWRRGQRNTNDQSETVMRDGNIDLVIAILEALQQEHHCLYQTILTPVTEFVCSQLSAKNRKSSKSELFFEDFEKLPPDEVARLYEWLTEKVDSLCAKLKPDPKEEEVEEEETVGDIDLFSLTPDGLSLTVNPKWLHHLQERRLSDEGQPRKVKEGEDDRRVGLVLEWVYGSIVSTAEKARDGAKRALGSWEPTIGQAHESLCTALKDQRDWETRSKKAKELLAGMLDARKEIGILAENSEYIIPGTAAAREPNADTNNPPDHLVIEVLKREELLTRAKLHVLQYERMMGDSQLRSLRAELMQVGATKGEDGKETKGEPEFERLRREMDDVKNAPRGLEGTFRSAAEKERHRAQLADSILEEQLEVQSAFREQGARLQGIYDKRQRTEIEMAKREQEITQLRNWQRNVDQLASKFKSLTAPADEVVEDKSQKQDVIQTLSVSLKGTENKTALDALRTTFHRDFKKQLYSDVDDTTFFNRIKKELKHMERRLEDGAVVLQHLEMFLINVACNDPGAAIGSLLVLPLLQDRLDKEAMEFATRRASLAEEEILRMEENEKMKAEAQLKLSKSKKMKEKQKRDKDRSVCDLKAKEDAAKAEADEQIKREQARLEEERRDRELQLEALREMEEKVIEERRQELLSEENGYWKLRMEADNSHKANVQQSNSDKSESDFTSVSNRRKPHERRGSWGGNRSSSYETSGRRHNSGSGELPTRKHNQDLNRPHRRNRSDAEAASRKMGVRCPRDVAVSNHSQQPPSSTPNVVMRKNSAPESQKVHNGRQSVWNHPDRRARRMTQQPKQPSSTPSHKQYEDQVAAQSTTEVASNTDVIVVEPQQLGSPEMPADVVSTPAEQNAPSQKKVAWVKGSIPASVIGKLETGASGDGVVKSTENNPSKVLASQSSSVTTDGSINSPPTPDGSEVDAPSVESDNGGKILAARQHTLSNIKTTCPHIEEGAKKASEAGSNGGDADDDSQASGFDSGRDASPNLAPMMMGPMQPGPYGMPMPGGMGPMGGFHPGHMHWMGAMGPGMRPMYPYMGPPPSYMRPPAASSAPSQESPQSPSDAPAASTAASNGGIRPPGPMYFYPPHMMPHGAPMMQPFMPMVPGHWMGYPMGPQPTPFLGPNRAAQKKFALRPTAKEFIPASMIGGDSSDGVEVFKEENVVSGSEEDGEEDINDPIQVVPSAIEQIA